MTEFVITPRSILPGRERFDVPTIKKDNILADKISQALNAVEDIYKVVANTNTGRVLVLFHPHQFGLGEIETLIKQAALDLPLDSKITNKKASGLKQQFKGVVDDNDLYEIIKLVENNSDLRKKAIKLSVAHSTLKLTSPVLMGLMIVSVLFPIPSLTKIGLTKGLQLATFSSLFVASKLSENKLSHSKAKAWNEYSKEVNQSLLHKVLSHVQALPISYIDNKSTEKLLEIVKGDIENINRFLLYTPAEFTDKATTIAIGSTLSAGISPVAFLLGLLPIPIITKINKMQQSEIAEKSAKGVGLDEQFNQLLANNLSGLSTVKSFTAEEVEIERLDKAKQAANDFNEDIANTNSYYGNLNELAFVGGLTLPMIYSCISVISNKTNMTGFMIQNSMIPGVLTASTGLEYGKSLYRQALASATRLNQLLAQPIEDYQSGSNDLKQLSLGMLNFDNISFGYDQHKVINNVSINIPAKGKIAFVGPTGSGKSTLMKLLLRFYPLDEGDITIDGQSIYDIDLHHLRQSIGLVSQDPFLFNGTIYDNLIYGRSDASFEEVVEACKIAQAYEFIEKAENGFDTQIGERGNKLSGGQRQRLSIARAVLKKSSILVLDEATSAVDNETEAAIRESVERISQQSTVIIIAHRLSTIRYVDTIYHLKDGTITESGSHQELLEQNGDYALLWRLQTAQDTSEKRDATAKKSTKNITTKKVTVKKQSSLIEMAEDSEVIVPTSDLSQNNNNGAALNS